MLRDYFKIKSFGIEFPRVASNKYENDVLECS